MRIKIERIAMCGGGLAYRLLVPVEDIPNYTPFHFSTICEKDGKFWEFSNATLPEAYFLMEPGTEKLDLAQEHEKKSQVRAYEIAVKVFPELRKVGKLPMLWASGLLKRETNKTVWITVED